MQTQGPTPQSKGVHDAKERMTTDLNKRIGDDPAARLVNLQDRLSNKPPLFKTAAYQADQQAMKELCVEYAFQRAQGVFSPDSTTEPPVMENYLRDAVQKAVDAYGSEKAHEYVEDLCSPIWAFRTLVVQSEILVEKAAHAEALAADSIRAKEYLDTASRLNREAFTYGRFHRNSKNFSDEERAEVYREIFKRIETVHSSASEALALYLEMAESFEEQKLRMDCAEAYAKAIGIYYLVMGSSVQNKLEHSFKAIKLAKKGLEVIEAELADIRRTIPANAEERAELKIKKKICVYRGGFLTDALARLNMFFEAEKSIPWEDTLRAGLEEGGRFLARNGSSLEAAKLFSEYSGDFFKGRTDPESAYWQRHGHDAENPYSMKYYQNPFATHFDMVGFGSNINKLNPDVVSAAQKGIIHSDILTDPASSDGEVRMLNAIAAASETLASGGMPQISGKEICELLALKLEDVPIVNGELSHTMRKQIPARAGELEISDKTLKWVPGCRDPDAYKPRGRGRPVVLNKPKNDEGKETVPAKMDEDGAASKKAAGSATANEEKTGNADAGRTETPEGLVRTGDAGHQLAPSTVAAFTEIVRLTQDILAIDGLKEEAKTRMLGPINKIVFENIEMRRPRTPLEVKNPGFISQRLPGLAEMEERNGVIRDAKAGYVDDCWQLTKERREHLKAIMGKIEETLKAEELPEDAKLFLLVMQEALHRMLESDRNSISEAKYRDLRNIREKLDDDLTTYYVTGEISEEALRIAKLVFQAFKEDGDPELLKLLGAAGREFFYPGPSKIRPQTDFIKELGNEKYL